MFPPFHIFKVQSDGSLRWVEAAADVERAKARAKALAASSPGEYVISTLTGEKISIKSPSRQIVFQIGYDEKELNVRAELFRRVGHHVISVPDNEAAKRALTSIQKVDVVVVGHTAHEQTRKEMVDWLKTNFPNVKIVALIPSANRQLRIAVQSRRAVLLRPDDPKTRYVPSRIFPFGDFGMHAPLPDSGSDRRGIPS